MTESRLELRRATLEDSRKIWAWRNEPSVRAVSFSTEEIPLEQHSAWFARRVVDPATLLLIAGVDDGEGIAEAGYLRFDIRGDLAEVNVVLDPAFRGHGLGRRLLKAGSIKALRDTGAQVVLAQVLEGNAASVTAFERAGFVRAGRREDTGAIEYLFARPSIVFRVDAGPAIGIGHLQRCLSLAAVLVEEGCRVSFVVSDTAAAVARVADAGWPYALVPDGASWSGEDAAVVVAEAAARRATVVIVDSDLESETYMAQLKDAGVLLCAVEDNGNDRLLADLVINPDVHGRLQRYTPVLADTTFLLGPQYSLLAAGYCEGMREAAVPPRSVLITLGGSDSHGLMAPLLRAAAALPEVRFEVVIGPFTGRDQDVNAALEGIVSRATVHRAPASMRSIIEACDLAVTAAGQTLYELAACGRPAIAIEVADNQRPQLQQFAEHGAVISAGSAADPGVANRAFAAAASLAADPVRAQAMAEAGRRLIDGRGAARVAAAILEMAAVRRRSEVSHPLVARQHR